ncbi:MAG: CHAP domain-containing protein [Moraxella sp.]|nr:CHAP domain-containing protein [Moraxella sp.]
MKRVFWLVSAIGLSVSQAQANDTGRVFIQQGDRQVNLTIQNPSTQVSSEDELNQAINRLVSNAQTAEDRAYNATQNYYANSNNFANNQPAGRTAVSPSRLGSSTAPSVAARLANNAAHAKTQGRCALYVRRALQSAGYSFTPQASAYMYANGTLSGAGFVKISNDNYQPQVGDVVVFNRTSKNPHGHIQIYTGSDWVSDFRQPNFSPYRQHNGYSVWRDAKYVNGQAGTYLAMNEQ